MARLVDELQAEDLERLDTDELALGTSRRTFDRLTYID